MRLPASRSWGILIRSLLCVVIALVFISIRAYLHNPDRGLPYRDSFVYGKADEWTALGGSWEVVSGMMRNDSDEHGAKMITGSPYWHNYSVEADVEMLGSGNAGLIIRSSNEEEGNDSYTGYFAGIRTNGSTLVLGRANHDWVETSKRVSSVDSVRALQWYHLKLLAYGCEIVTEVTSLSQAEGTSPTSLGITDPDCFRSGRVGLRSYDSGGVWRNVIVRPATHQDLIEMLQNTASMVSAPPKPPSRDSELLSSHLLLEQAQVHSEAAVQSIESLRLTSLAKPATATVRGVVVLATPELIVEDFSGGVRVLPLQESLLKIGDEVEVTGEVHPGNFSSTIEKATVQMLGARSPTPPVSVTASQAATGKFDATFIEVQGRLVAKERGPDNKVIFDFDEGPQSFRAILNPGHNDFLFDKLKLNSNLRLQGVSVSDSTFTHNLTPFVMLLRSNEDIQVLAGPPWWSTGHLIAIVVGILLLALVAAFLYNRVETLRFHAILEERGRLAHEMHDTLAQSFAGIGFQLSAIRNGVPDERDTLCRQLDLASKLVVHSHEEARRSIAMLRPEWLESDDFLSALELCALRMVEGGCVKVVSEREGDQRTIPLRIADALYSIGQEAVANAVRHAHPTVLTIRLKYSNNLVCLTIKDNGVGFTPGDRLQGFGIRGMRRRAKSIFANLQIESSLGEGTSIQVETPLPPRITFFSFPKVMWTVIKEHWIHARRKKYSNSHSDRR